MIELCKNIGSECGYYPNDVFFAEVKLMNKNELFLATAPIFSAIFVITVVSVVYA